MTNGEYIKSQIKDSDIMQVLVNGVANFGILADAEIVFTYTYGVELLASKERGFLIDWEIEQRMWLIWLSKQYNEKIWKEVLDKYKE